LFGLPLLFGLGAADDFSWVYYPMVVLVLVALALAAAGASSLLVMAIVRVVPARRVAEVLGFVGAIASILCSQSGQLSRLGRVTGNQAAGMLHLVSRLDVPWSPLSWAGRGLLGIGRGEWLQGVAYLALVLGLSGGVFFAALGAAERLYYSGWARVQAGRRRKVAVHPSAVVTSRREGPLGRVLSRPVRAIVVKDFLVLTRDLRNMSQLVTPLILGVIYAVMLVRGGGVPPPGRGEAPEWFMSTLRSALAYGNLAIALFIGWSLLTRLAGMGFSQEGRNYWLLKGSPVRPSQLLAAKFLVAYLPAVAMGWAFLLIISVLRGFDLAQLSFDLAVVALCIAGAAGINLAFGVIGANMNWEDPRHMLRSGVGCLSTLVSLVFLPACLAFFVGPTFLAAFLGFPTWVGRLFGLLLGGALGVAAASVPPRLVRDRVPQLGET
jgi:ABC-2 type transport system permease protein